MEQQKQVLGPFFKNIKIARKEIFSFDFLAPFNSFTVRGLTDKAEMLKEDIIDRIHKLTDQLTEKYIEEANDRYKAGDLIEAYESLESIEINDPNIELFKSKIAFELGERRYNNILGADFKVNEIEIRDAIYWFSQVNKDSEFYNKSRKYIETLRKYLNK